MKIVLGTVLLTITVSIAHAQDPPEVTSGTLVANLVADPNTMVLEEGFVSSWSAANDSSITLSSMIYQGAPSISFNQDELNGLGCVVVNDPSSNKHCLEGSLGTGLSNATIFWLGHFNPGQNGSIGDGSGQYLYSLGADGPEGSQLDAQIDDGFYELYGGSGTDRGDSISYLNGVYSTWMTKYYAEDGGPGHDAYVNGTNLNVPTETTGYSTGDHMVLFAYQDSGGNGDSGYNFVGNVHQILIYDGVLDANDTQAITDYFDSKLNPPPPCPADVNGDGTIGFNDVVAVLSAWGDAGGAADVDGDGSVGFSDVLMILNQWGPC